MSSSPNPNLKSSFSEALAITSIIEQALSFIPSHDRDIWITCGMGIKSELGDAGFVIWNKWSALADNYGARDAANTWRSFKASGGITIRTVFHLAQEHGYRCDPNYKAILATAEAIALPEARRKADSDLLASKRKAASQKAGSIWNEVGSDDDAASLAIIDHPYLRHKRTQAHGARIYSGEMIISGMSCNNALMIPMWLNEKITSLQFINAEGKKRFLPDGEKGGYLIGKMEAGTPVCICEGFATGASIHEATGYAVIVAFDAGNLRKMAVAVKAKQPDALIVLCADDDPTATGQRKATEAAQAVGGLLAMPKFGEPRPAGSKDFNDMTIYEGWNAVKLAIEAARPVTEKKDATGSPIAGTNKLGNTPIVLTAPEPLPSLPAVLPFDYAFLPNVLRECVRDISERMQCPPDFATVGIIVMIAALIGRKLGIRPMQRNDWIVIPNLWGAVVGNSGIMKSPTLNEVLIPIKKLQATAFEEYNNAKNECERAAELARIKNSVRKTEVRAAYKKNKAVDVSELLKWDEGDEPPTLKRYITNNASYEALGELLIENPNGILVEADELVGLLKQLDASGQEVARSFYLTAADGDKPYTFDRIMRGKGLHVPALCISIIGGIQPGILAEYVRGATSGGAGADGLLQRFGLMVYPDINPAWKEVDRYPDSAARESVRQLAERMDSLLPMEIGAEDDPHGGAPFLRFDEAAQALFSEWRVKLETRLRSGEEHPAIVSHLSKYRKLVPSLALIFHLCDKGHGRVDENTLLRAIAYSEYLESHTHRIYSYATRSDIEAAKTLLKRLESGKLASTFKARDLYQKGWAGLETPAKAQSAINLLLEYHHLLEEEITTGGRPATYYHWIKVKPS
jgi:putative DNA primase/helicase